MLSFSGTFLNVPIIHDRKDEFAPVISSEALRWKLESLALQHKVKTHLTGYAWAPDEYSFSPQGGGRVNKSAGGGNTHGSPSVAEVCIEASDISSPDAVEKADAEFRKFLENYGNQVKPASEAERNAVKLNEADLMPRRLHQRLQLFKETQQHTIFYQA